MRQYCRRKLEDLRLGYITEVMSREEQNDYRKRLMQAADDEKNHLFFIFNWFSPKKVWDFCSLGLELYMRSSELDGELLGSVYLKKADDFLRKLGTLPQNPVDDDRNHLITATGFSLGGSIAHAFAYRLR